jgi:hypothetical protein
MTFFCIKKKLVCALSFGICSKTYILFWLE